MKKVVEVPIDSDSASFEEAFTGAVESCEENENAFSEKEKSFAEEKESTKYESSESFEEEKKQEKFYGKLLVQDLCRVTCEVV